MDIFEDDLDILDIIDAGFPRPIYVRANPFEGLDDLNFYRRYRLTKPTCLQVLELIEDHIEFDNDLNNSVSPINQLLTTLRYYASGAFLINVADLGGMHTSTASRIVARVSAALARLAPQYIKMPQTEEQKIEIQRGFYEIARFPRVIGTIDGSHIRIQSPGGDEAEVYRNRKGYFSINIQAVTNHKLQIMDLVARWPGSTHDSTIFNNSRIKVLMENGTFRNSVLLGDSGYPLRSYFLTPFLNTATRAEQLYNESHIRTRNTVERLFGNWKRRFPVLALGMRLKLDTVLTIIVAAAVLQNIARQNSEPEPLPAEDIDENELERLIQEGNIQLPEVPADINDPRNYRNELIQNYFANL